MKTLKISDETHSRLTAVVGQLIAESGRIKTYEDAINDLLLRPATLPKGLIEKIEDFRGRNKQWGFLSNEEFLKDSAVFHMQYLTKMEKENVQLEKDQ